MHDEQWKIFEMIRDAGSFSRAGEQSYLTKQAMMKQMNQLEEELGFSLFERSRSGVKLTSAGETFSSGMTDLMIRREALIRQCREASGYAQMIRVGNVEHQALLTPVTQAFSARYPQIHVRQTVHPNHSGEWRVENDIQDVAETFHSEYTHLGNYTYTALTTVPYLISVRPDHPLTGRQAVSLQDLTAYPTVIFPMMLGRIYAGEVQGAFSDQPEHLIERMDVDNQVPVAYESLHSDQILITANPFINSIGALSRIPLDTGWTREYGIIYREPMTAPVRKYVELAKEIYSA